MRTSRASVLLNLLSVSATSPTQSPSAMPRQRKAPPVQPRRPPPPRPQLPDHVDRLELHNLRVCRGKASLRFERSTGQGVAVNVLGTEGGVEVRVNTPTTGTAGEQLSAAGAT